MVRSPSSRAALIALALCAAACSDDKPRLSPELQAKVDPFITSTPPAGMFEANVNFDDKVHLVGYTISPQRALHQPGNHVEVALIWRVDKQLEPGWELFTHLLGEDGRVLLNLDAAGPLRKMDGFEGQPLPPSQWLPGRLYVDIVRFIVPGDPSPMMTLGAGIVHRQKGRMRVVGPGGDSENRLDVIKLRTGLKSGANFRKNLQVHKLPAGAEITIDGRLDEPAWAGARKAGPFVDPHSGRPNPGIPAQGSARVLWDDAHLYVGFEVADKHVTGGFAPDTKDPHLWERDTVEIMIDPDGDGDNKDYYELQISPQNLVFDSQFDDYNKPNGGPEGPFGHEEWSARLTSAVTIDGTLDDDKDEDRGYTVEARIPWSSFEKAKRSPPAPGDTWRMNFYAMQRNGGSAWSPLYGEGNFHRARRFGFVKFLGPAGEGPEGSAPAASGASSAPSASAAPSAGPAPKPSGSAAKGAGAPTKDKAPPAPSGKEPGLWAGPPDR